ncbi:MAG: hypothetical protein IPN29_06620 [Saprospiraceae bacterium]|nr:hypothetical protein [Saprospiraceae bacterium]
MKKVSAVSAGNILFAMASSCIVASFMEVIALAMSIFISTNGHLTPRPSLTGMNVELPKLVYLSVAISSK